MGYFSKILELILKSNLSEKYKVLLIMVLLFEMYAIIKK